MNDFREHDGWLDAAVAERLLSGQDIAEADRRAAGLTRLLAAAATPLPADSAREQAALAAFRQARDGRPGRGPQWRTVGSRPVKALAAAVGAVFVLGGVAIAEQTGNLPLPFHSGATTAGPLPSTTTDTTPGTPGADAPYPGATHGPTPPTGSPQRPGQTTQPSSHPAATSAAPDTQDPKSLCGKYAEAAGRGQTLESRSEARLEQAAGGKADVDAYCARLLGTAVVHGKDPSSPSSRPTGRPTPRK